MCLGSAGTPFFCSVNNLCSVKTCIAEARCKLDMLLHCTLLLSLLREQLGDTHSDVLLHWPELILFEMLEISSTVTFVCAFQMRILRCLRPGQSASLTGCPLS